LRKIHPIWLQVDTDHPRTLRPRELGSQLTNEAQTNHRDDLANADA
jgi:hypothetical protein